MSIQKRALLLRNQFGFKVAAKVYEDGSFSVRLFNFIKQPTNANTLPEEEAIKLRDFLNECYPKREPVLARPEHGCSVEEAMALTMERYGQPGGALEQLAELERNPVRDYCVRSAERMRQIVHVVCHNCELGKHSMLMRADVDISTIDAPKCLCGAQTEWVK